MSLFNECVDDIRAAVQFAHSRVPNVVLQGHSLGCDRVLHFQIVEGSAYDFVLLAPCDSYRLQELWLGGETVEQQISRIRSLAQEEGRFLDPDEYGIREGDSEYRIPITRDAWLSIAAGPPFRLLRLERPTDFRIPAQCFVYIGGSDELQTASREAMLRHIGASVLEGGLTAAAPNDGGHGLEGVEEAVVAEIARWLRDLDTGCADHVSR